MAKEYLRTDRVADVLQRELARLIEREVKDPRLPKFITITDIKVSRDFAYSKVFISVLSQSEQTPEEIKTTIKILNKAAGFLRSQLAKTVKLRTVPKLTFYFDDTLQEGRKLQDLINKANENDEQA